MPKTLNHYSNGIKKHVFLFLLPIYAFNLSFSQNAIVTENLNAGVPSSQWDLPVNSDGTFGDQSILGFGTDISVNKGSTIGFKITVTSGTDKTFGIKIYRIG
ncbi:MAG TPA: hypothetical protein VNW49_05755, partial [Puia sp.]|nr:hypothetical protein [Puia sp.]